MTKAMKNDGKDVKPDHSYLISCFMDQVSYCMMAGALKYARNNFYNGHEILQLTAATSRHNKRIEEGEFWDLDTMDIFENGITKDDGTVVKGYGKKVYISHAACIACNQLMMLGQFDQKTLIDNTFKGLNLYKGESNE